MKNKSLKVGKILLIIFFSLKVIDWLLKKSVTTVYFIMQVTSLAIYGVTKKKFLLKKH